jgi:hypothetical protein
MAHVDRVPLGHFPAAPHDHVGGEPERGARREHIGAARQVLLDDIVLRGAGQRREVGALFLGHGCVQRQQPGGRGVDGHRGVHLLKRQVLEQLAHVAEMGNRHPELADLAAGQRVVGVKPHLGRQIEGHRQPGLALGEVGAVQPIAVLCRGMARIGAEDPRLVARRGRFGLRHGRSPLDGAGAIEARLMVQCNCPCRRASSAEAPAQGSDFGLEIGHKQEQGHDRHAEQGQGRGDQQFIAERQESAAQQAIGDNTTDKHRQYA